MSSTTNCLGQANQYLSESAQVQLRVRAAQHEQDGAPEKDALVRAAREVLDGVQAQLEVQQSRPRDVTQTEAFKRWFGDSQVVDAEGKPLVVYHGTTADFDGFAAGGEHHFASNPEEAARYAPDVEAGSRVMPVYVALRNPLIVETDMQAAEAWDTMSDQYRDDARAGGHDGVIVRAADGSMNVIAFKPEQIKSAIGNRGTFDPQSADITRSARRDHNPDLPRGTILEPTEGELALDEEITAAEERAAKLWSEGKRKSLDRLVTSLKPQVEKLGINDEQLRGMAQSLFYNERQRYGDDMEEFAEYRAEAKKVDALRARMREFLADRVGPPLFDSMRQLRDFQRPITQTQNFKRWFDGSKVVDKEGRPLIVFHGTNRDFSEFRTVLPGDKQVSNNNWMGELGSWFAAPNDSGEYEAGNAEYTADTFAELRSQDDEMAEGAVVYPVFLSIKNPYETETYEDIAEQRDESGGGKAFREKLIAEGYDGVVVRESNTDGGQYRDDWIAFYPHQIKSAIGNDGSFDATSKDITRSTSRRVAPALEEAGATTEMVEAYLKMRKAQDVLEANTGLETAAEKARATRARTAFFKLADQGDDGRKMLNVIARAFDSGGEEALFDGSDIARSTSRRNFLISTAAALAAEPADAEVTLGRAKPLDEQVANARVTPEVEKILAGNGRGTTNIQGYKALRQAMDTIASSGPQQLRPLAGEISKLLPNDTLMLAVEGKDMNAHGVLEFFPVVRMRLFDGPRGISRGLRYSTVLHESLHAAVAARYKTLNSGLVRSNDEVLGMSAPKAAAALEQFKQVFQEFRDVAVPALRGMDKTQGLGLSIEEAASNPDEFFVRALTQPELQAWMAKQEYQGKTLLQRFIGWVKTSLLGFKKDGTAPSWLDAALMASDDLLKAMGGDPANWARLRKSAELSEKRDSIRRSTSRNVTDTPQFKRWFGGSKVRDEDGEPKILYHMTPGNFHEFLPGGPDARISGPAVWFSGEADYQAAAHNNYARDGGFREGVNVMPVYVRMERPLLIDDQVTLDWAREVFAGGSREFPQVMTAQWVENVTRDSEYDGIIFRGSAWNGPARDDEYIVFDGTQIKSAIGNAGEFDADTANITRSASRPVFYSQLEIALEQVPERLATMSAAQWKLWLEANAPKAGVKKEEIEWSGLPEYLKMRGKEKASRDELVAYVRDNGVLVEDVVLGGTWVPKPPFNDVPSAIRYLAEFLDTDEAGVREEYGYKNDTDYIFAASEAWRNNAAGNPNEPSKFDQYTLPGGKNYREVLITLPSVDKDAVSELPRARKRLEAMEELVVEHRNVGDEATASKFEKKAAVLRDSIAEMERKPQSKLIDNFYHRDHWGDVPNVLAHLRVDDRTDADGKKVLFINEIQSDWAQKGRTEGFAVDDNAPANVKEYLKLKEGYGNGSLTNEEYDRYYELRDHFGGDVAAESVGSIPRGPFVQDTKSWVSLAIKRAIMMAARGGYDRVAFITGEQAADAMSVAKAVEKIDWQPLDNIHRSVMIKLRGEGRLSIYVNEDGVVDTMSGATIGNGNQNFNGKPLSEVVGKGVAEKIMTDDSGELSGDGLKIGQRGMVEFYDKIVPQVANDVLKKIGGWKVGKVEVVRSSPSEPGVKMRATGTDWNARYQNYSVQPGFDITSAMREKLENGMPLFSAARAAREMDVGFGYKVSDWIDSSKKVSWWDKTVGTPYHLAQKNPTFKRAYDAIQHFINDTSRYATRAADMAPNILPKLEHLTDVWKSPLSAEDVEALADPIFKGTLVYTRDVNGDPVEAEDVGNAGIVWTDKELEDMWGLDERRRGLYREFRKATNKSIADLAVTGMLRLAGEDAEGVRGRVLAATNVQAAAEILADHLGFLAAHDPKRADTLQNTARVIKEQADQARGLIARGYAPLSRFGEFTVYAPGIGETGYFEMFETERDANRRARELRAEFPDQEVSVGTMSKESYKLFKGVTPETLALFGDALGLEESASDRESQVFQEYLKLAKSTRSAMKRLIHRKGVAGYSNDVGRVLAGFVYSNARQSATNLHAKEMLQAAAAVPEGDLKDNAIKLLEYAQNPNEEAQAIRGLLFVNYIGGSVASAITNLTQSMTTTWPTLSMHFGISKAGKAMGDALQVRSSRGDGDDDMKAALKRAEEDGITAPHETHQLMAQSQGKGGLKSGDGTLFGNSVAKLSNTWSKGLFAWGKMFSWAEVVNREVAFIAAYKLAREKGSSNPYEFAKKIVADTQFVMNKGNNPVWSRGPVGATLFTFRKFMINYLEGLARMYGNGPEGKKAFALSLAVLFLLAGTTGFPFAEDLEDAIDFVAQRVLNKSWSTKQAKREFFAGLLGDAGADFIDKGISGISGFPIDVSGRLGLGNIIPGTGALQKKTDYSRDVAEVAGAAGDFAKRMASAGAAAAQGELGLAAQAAAPVALTNVYKGMEMISLGYYKDAKNRKVIDTTAAEAVMKMIGFQPSSVDRIQDATRVQQSLIAQNKIRETEIADKWARGRYERKPELVEEAKAELRAWNEANPQSPIKIDAKQINKRVQQAMMGKAQRLSKTAPKEIRKAVSQELREAESE